MEVPGAVGGLLSHSLCFLSFPEFVRALSLPRRQTNQPDAVCEGESTTAQEEGGQHIFASLFFSAFLLGNTPHSRTHTERETCCVLPKFFPLFPSFFLSFIFCPVNEFGFSPLLSVRPARAMLLVCMSVCMSVPISMMTAARTGKEEAAACGTIQPHGHTQERRGKADLSPDSQELRPNSG